MILEYPSYYEKFRCIGGRCPDTCCAGWEVDVDEDSDAYYRSVSGPFGERLRASLRKDADGSCFPLTAEGNCPFLRKDLLCDLYIELGEESLCQTCTEYPRYYMAIGSYEQIDLSLSCMELSRIFFTEPAPITYVRAENEIPGEELTEEEQETMVEVLALRNRCIAILQEGTGSFEEKLTAVRALVSEAQGLRPLDADQKRAYLRENAAALLRRMQQFDSLRPEWDRVLQACDLDHADERIAVFLSEHRRKLDPWFTRLAVYFIYRYFIDTCLDGDIEIELRLVHRSLRMLQLLLYVRCIEKAPELEDIIYTAHLFSKEAEHDEDNVGLLKAEN